MRTKWFFRGYEGGDPATRGRFTLLARIMRTRPSALDPLRTDERPDAAFEAAWRPLVKGRLLLLLALVGLWVAGIEARLVWLQVIQSASLSAKALRQQQMKITPEALRGDIVDRHGNILAFSVEADSIGADPTKVVDPRATAHALCRAMSNCSVDEEREILAKLRGDRQFVYIRRSHGVSPEDVQQVAELKLPGVVLQTDTRRYYPRYELAAQVLGFVGMDNTGQAGVEYAYDRVVRGEDGLAYAQVDARRKKLETRVERAPVPGATLELTLDLYLQYIAERELKAGVLANRARSGTAIIMDPQSGDILAMANYPTFNPNAFRGSTEMERRNRATQDVYEPGSTFKIVTASAALEEGIVKPSDLINTDPGYITIPGRSRRITDTSRHGVISFEDVIVFSSNVGAIKVGLRTGAEKLGRYVHRLGFGQTLSPDFVGESRGIWGSGEMTDSALASVSMGYQVSVTPLQMAAAASAVANGGLLMEPHVVRAVIRDGKREDVAPKIVRRAIAPETAATLTTIMEGVTERGTAKHFAQLDRFLVAGKTGTANKAVDGSYSNTDFNASFVGFVPSRRPVFTILVVIDTPRAGSHFGGPVAGPIFKRIAEAALQQAGVPPTISTTPPVIIAHDGGATKTQPRRDPTVIPALASIAGQGLMPDVRGLGARDAIRVLAAVGLSARMSGAGSVANQNPPPGAPVEAGGVSVLDLDRSARRPPASGDHR